MSHTYYNELWLIARDDLEKLLELDRRVQQQPRTRRIAQGLNLILPTYLRYRNLVQRLIVCHDQMVQTQKRALIKRVLDCATGRMLEYKQAVVNLENSDYEWPDDHMNQLKYTPGDVEISVCATGKDLVDQRRKRIQELMEEARTVVEIPSEETLIEVESHSDSQETTTRARRRKVKEEAPEEEEVPAIFRETPEQKAAREAREAVEEAMTKAILLVQSHERGRVGRQAGFEVERIYNYQRKVQTGEIVPTKTPKAARQKAAWTIQRAWRRYLAKKRMKKRVERLEELLEITVPRRKCDKVFAKDRENFWKRLEVVPEIATGVEKAAEEDRARLWKLRGPGLIEDITDEIREWFIVWYNEAGHFDVYPAANVGGSVLIATGQTLTPREYLIEKAAKAAKDEPDKAKKKTTRAKRKRASWMPETNAFTLLDATNQDFIDDWSFRDDLGDPPQKIYRDLIMDKLGYELQLEMRQVVDELMRLELRRLNIALRRDYKADKRELDIPKQKSGKKKKKKRKKRKKRDPLGAVPVEDMFKELARADIIRAYPLASMKDWLGDLSYQNYEAAREFRDYKHRIGEIKEVVMDYCVLPLSSKEIHQVAPLIRSVCICGLARYGKSFLVNAICSELGALMIDMTPEVLVGKYDGRRDQKKLTNMIAKVAREFAPTVIFVDNGERPWLKKVPVEERPNKPKRFARYFPKLVKSIKRGDQILFLTTSSQPYKARGPFMRIHNKFIMIPLTDYNTMYMIYKDLLLQYHGVDRAIDVSTLAKMSVGIPLEFVRTAIERVLNVRRRIRLRFHPLALEEIMEEVLKYEHTPQKTLKQFVKFENRTPLGRKRARMILAAKKERERLKGGRK